MPVIDDFLSDELSSSSSVDILTNATKKKPVQVYTHDFSSEYDDDEGSGTEFSDASMTEPESTSSEEAWNSRQVGKSKLKRRPAVTEKRRRKNIKRMEYEGITDSEDNEESESQAEKSQKVSLEIPLIEEKGWAVDGILEFDQAKNKYLVKWKNRSYKEITWEDSERLDAFGTSISRKMQNIVERMSAISEEDLEEEKEKRLQYCDPERVLSMSKGSHGTNWYLVKWKGLQYKDSTWEAEEVLFPAHQFLVDSYLTRSMMQRHQFKKPRSFSKVTQQDGFLYSSEGRLRDYQLDGVNWLTFSWFKGINVILADEMGLGKTIQSVVFLSALLEKYQFRGPSMVVVPLSTIDAWQREFARWSPNLNVVVYNGDAGSRRYIRHYEFYSNDSQVLFDVLLSTYELVLKDKDDLSLIKWKLLIVDEGHRLKNNESQLFEALNELIPPFHRVLITGTPLQNSLKELWSLLHFLDSNSFPDYGTFAAAYAPPLDKEETTAEAETRTATLHSLLKPHLLRRLKKDVERSLPAKREQILRVELSPEQRNLYRLVLAKNYIELQRHSKARNLINILGELKKICNHPSVFKGLQPADDQDLETDLLRPSSKLSLLDMLMRRLIKEGHRALIFSQSVKMLDYLECYLQKRCWSFQRIDGGVPSEARKRAIDAFNAPGSSCNAFLLSTRAGGLGINLETADTVIIYDSDWNPQNDLQAMARAHRIGQTRAVNIYRLVCSGTIEETILERAKQKMVLDHLIIQRMQPGSKGPVNKDSLELQAILKFGAQSLFSTQTSVTAQSGVDLDAILERAQDTSSTSKEAGSDFLGQFHVAEIGTLPAWEQIIPETERQKAEEAAAEQELFARESALQEAIMTSSSVRKTRKIKQEGDGTLKAVLIEVAKTGKASSAALEAINDKSDDTIIAGYRIGLLRQRIKIMSKLESLFDLPNVLAFRLDFKVKPPAWSRPWTPKDDAMLLLGLWRHGFDWDAIKNDQELAINCTFKKGTLPQSVHLVRRVDYLFNLMSEAPPSEPEKQPQKTTKKSMDKIPYHKIVKAKKNSVLKVLPLDEVKIVLKSVKKQVAFLNSLEELDIDKSINEICDAVRVIGDHISTFPSAKRPQIWQTIVSVWPTEITPEELLQLYTKLVK